MKKWLTLFLLLVTITATFYPCFSKEDCCMDELIPKHANHNNHQSDCNCSPFVTCGACTGFTLTAAVEVQKMIEEKQPHYSLLISLSPSTYIVSLLQPPRIG